MRVTGKKILTKLKLKQRGNLRLLEEIDLLIYDLESNSFTSFEQLKKIRKDADIVHSDGFYFFNIHIHRTLILLEMNESGEATIVGLDHMLNMKTFLKIIKELSQVGLDKTVG